MEHIKLFEKFETTEDEFGNEIEGIDGTDYVPDDDGSVFASEVEHTPWIF